MYKRLKDECSRIKFNCWLARMAAARFMDNLELYEDGLIQKEDLTCYMPTVCVSTLKFPERTNSQDHVGRVDNNAA